MSEPTHPHGKEFIQAKPGVWKRKDAVPAIPDTNPALLCFVCGEPACEQGATKERSVCYAHLVVRCPNCSTSCHWDTVYDEHPLGVWNCFKCDWHSDDHARLEFRLKGLVHPAADDLDEPELAAVKAGEREAHYCDGLVFNPPIKPSEDHPRRFHDRPLGDRHA